MIINETRVVSFFIAANADDEGKVDDLPQLQRRQPPVSRQPTDKISASLIEILLTKYCNPKCNPIYLHI